MMCYRAGRVSAALVAAAGLLAFGGTTARAGFTVSLDATSPTGSGPYTYTYSATITSSDVIVTGDFFRIYDFAGYVNNTASAPTGWTESIDNSNPTPPPNVLLTHGDDATIPNITFTYVGTAPIAGSATIDGFSAVSVYGVAATVKDFVGRVSNATDGSNVDSVGAVMVPGVPEPSALLSCSIGALVLLGHLVRTRRKA